MATIAEQLSHYTHALRYDDLPDVVVHEVKRRVIDTLGCAVGAYSGRSCTIAREAARSVKSRPGATIWGTTHKSLPELATFANGTMVRYLDCNDTYLSKEPAHPSDNIPPALAVAEEEGANGKRLITAIVLGYEVHCRLCDAAALRPRGWDHVTYGPITSALVAAKLMRLSREATVHAVSLAGVANIALRQTRVGEISMWKACAFANAARNGVFAAMLARQGMTGPALLFEGDKGFMRLVSGPFELKPFGARDGSFKILDTYIKNFPVEYHAQGPVEATLAMRQELQAREGKNFIDRIESIEVRSYDVAIEIIGREKEKWYPQTRETADHSLPYCVGVALMDGKVGPAQFTPKRFSDPVLLGLLQKVGVVEDPGFTDRYPAAMSSRIIIRTRSNQELIRQVDYPKGHPRNPLTDHEVEAKFRELAKGRLSSRQISRLLDRLWHLEQVKDIDELMPLLRVR